MSVFIILNFYVITFQNGALFWWNLHRNGQGNVYTLHAGCPVIVGDKWGMIVVSQDGLLFIIHYIHSHLHCIQGIHLFS